MRMKNKRLGTCQAPKSNLCRPISALDYAYATANHRPELILGRSVSQSAARIWIISHHMSKPSLLLRFS